MSDAIEVAFDQPMAVGECPLWNPAEACLYWVDIDGFAIHGFGTLFWATVMVWVVNVVLDFVPGPWRGTRRD